MTLNFYKHGFFSNPDGDIQQKISPLGSKYAGVYIFIQTAEEEEDMEKPFWMLRFEDLNKKISPLWKGNLSSQGILDAVANEYVNEKVV